METVKELIRELGPCAPGKLGVVYAERLRQDSLPMKQLPSLIPIIAPPAAQPQPEIQLDFPPPVYLPDDISQSITVLTRAVRPAKPQRPRLPIDPYDGCPYLVVVNPYETTENLVAAAVRHFQECGAVLEVIRLSCFGYFTALTQLQSYMPHIRYECVPDPNFTIMLRGLPWKS